MKKYRPIVEYYHLINNEMYDAEVGMKEDPNGEYVRYEDVGWKRNCAETPVPHAKDMYLNVMVITYPWPWCVLCGEDKKRGRFWACVNGDGDEFVIDDPGLITRWLEVPKVEEE